MDPWNFLLRGALVTALVLLVGVPPTLSFVVFPELERRGLATARAHHVALAIIGAALIGAGLAASALVIGDAPTAELDPFLTWVSATTAGRAWVALTVVASGTGALTVARYATPDRVSRRFWLSTVFVGALVMLIAFCWTRYSVAVESPTLAILVKVGHMAGGALWVGGLAVLAVLPTLMPRDTDVDSDREIETERARLVLSAVRRFSIVAVTGVTIAFATGVVIAAWHVPTLGALVTTPYGLLLSAKVGLVVIAAAIGGFNRIVLHDEIAYSVGEAKEMAALPGMLTGIRPRIAATDAVSTATRSIRLELGVLILAMGLSVALTTAVTPSYELVRGVALTEFATLLELGAISIALAGALALGYEIGKFGVERRRRSDETSRHSRDDAQLSRD